MMMKYNIKYVGMYLNFLYYILYTHTTILLLLKSNFQNGFPYYNVKFCFLSIKLEFHIKKCSYTLYTYIPTYNTDPPVCILIMY